MTPQDVLYALQEDPQAYLRLRLLEPNKSLVPSFREEGGNRRVWCRFCVVWHTHGSEVGHRVAHCLTETARYDGYLLTDAGDWTDAVRQGVPRAATANMHYDLREAGRVNKIFGKRVLDAFAADDAMREHMHIPSLAMTFAESA